LVGNIFQSDRPILLHAFLKRHNQSLHAYFVIVDTRRSYIIYGNMFV